MLFRSIHDTVQCRTIFATHYHELTQLAHEKAHVVNLTMAVKEWQDRVIFLRDGKVVRDGGRLSAGEILDTIKTLE